MNLLKSAGFLLKSLYLRPFHHLNVRGDFRIFSNLLVSFHAFLGNFGKNVGKFSEFTNGLSAGYPQEFLLRILHFACALKLMIHKDPVLIELDIRHGKTAKFGNAKAGIEQNEESIVILIVVRLI